MPKILVVESDIHDADRFRALLAGEDFEMVRCDSGAAAETLLSRHTQEDFAAAIILWEISGPPFGFSLLAQCRQLWPAMPVIIVSGMLDARLATRAFKLGASDFLEKPVESSRVKSCLKSLLAKHDSFSPLVDALRQKIIGESTALLSALKETAKLIPHSDSRALFIGDSGTGKELFATAIHDLGSRPKSPLVPVNVGAIPPGLIESELFGHEKGSFTGALTRRIGCLEEAADGTLFLDEIGELEISLQVKLLRAIQERQFRRVGGEQDLPFRARLVCATNRNLAQSVLQGTFRQDLFHRIAEKTIQIPPLRERRGDVDVLLNHFLDAYRNGRQIRFARETLTILRSYTFPGNIRELQNLVRGALIDCEGDTILPRHLPLPNMVAFMTPDEEPEPETYDAPPSENPIAPAYQELVAEVMQALPQNWLQRPYRETARAHESAFDRIYLRHLHERLHGNITRCAAAAGVDTKTFRKRWKECGLSPLGTREDEAED
ncbi:MAG TPA: sigma-54 dependent transcriptional regulator [Blastocatellia bacterium]|nr:sigma-54 dependent transcriptional regulator [Blastocatellia bacterium]HMV86820.1 sigma-54 dependent transcriptional regulator [Blastocatellia bacterium]HMX24691.1 sigma-54 dependent transcriptional regulator [Blastocatellia bacterium]HMY72727.1 sigma-54 dependent transcriptional regulator [Blastocatellia bacterium]HMZ17787.1 sigma-54 dependent transcriptional regulator [Blastocatellia bacterium]